MRDTHLEHRTSTVVLYNDNQRNFQHFVLCYGLWSLLFYGGRSSVVGGLAFVYGPSCSAVVGGPAFVSSRMNLLAHAYLSFNDPDILAGNMISDFVKGKKQYGYPKMIQKGIRLHRSIDDFTDTHPATREIKKFFQPVYGLYSGAFTDIVYDYFLANDKAEFDSEALLEKFTAKTYSMLDLNLSVLPVEFLSIYPHMKTYNWLYNYRLNEGILKSFNGLSHRAKYITDSSAAYSIFLDNKSRMYPYYQDFFPMLKIYARDTLEELLNAD